MHNVMVPCPFATLAHGPIIWDKYLAGGHFSSFQPVDPIIGCPLSEPWADGCCRSPNCVFAILQLLRPWSAIDRKRVLEHVMLYHHVKIHLKLRLIHTYETCCTTFEICTAKCLTTNIVHCLTFDIFSAPDSGWLADVYISHHSAMWVLYADFVARSRYLRHG